MCFGNKKSKNAKFAEYSDIKHNRTDTRIHFRQTMPGKSSIPANVRRTTDLRIPVKKDGTADLRYTLPQFTRNDGKRDMRTVPTRDRK
jgi:hypothetical protein